MIMIVIGNGEISNLRQYSRVLSPKPWKLEGIIRLFMQLFVCMCAGWLLLAVLYSKTPPGGRRLLFIAVAVAAISFLIVAMVQLQKAWTLETFRSRGLAVLTIFYFGFVLTAWAQHLGGALPQKTTTTQMVVAMLSLQGAMIVLVTLFLHKLKSSWVEAFGLLKDVRRAVLLGVLVACLFLPVAFVLKLVSERAIERFTRGKAEQQEAVQTIEAASSPVSRVVLGFVTILLAPWGEETLFRGILYSTIRQTGFPKIALWLNSVLFALIHMNMAAFLPLLVLAIALTILYEKTDNLLAPITAHAAFNAIEFVFMMFVPGGG